MYKEKREKVGLPLKRTIEDLASLIERLENRKTRVKIKWRSHVWKNYQIYGCGLHIIKDDGGGRVKIGLGLIVVYSQ